jgi:8-amino-7-oxononanoate synthase
VIESAVEAARHYGTGNHGPRMLCGNLEIHEQFEKKIAEFFSKENGLVFSSGYLACVSVITGIARKGDLLVMDRFCHNSL